MNRATLRQVVSTILAGGLACANGIAEAQLEEITVTAQKVESDIQRTPITMSAISGEDLEGRQVADVEALMKTMPNVDFGVSLGTTRIAIRGIGFDNLQGGNEGRVAFHQDGVYYSRPASVQGGFFDIERVEALRGPQGTLYGRNATGGVINVLTREPAGQTSGYLNVTGGNYGLFKGTGAIGGPLTDKLSMRLAFQAESRDGYGTNETTGVEVDDKHSKAFRLKLRYAPTDSLDFTLAGDHYEQRDHANGYVYFQHFPLSSPAVPGAVEPQLLTGELFGGAFPTEDRNTAGDTDTSNSREFNGISGTAKLSLGSVDVTSITAWRWSRLRVVSDIDQTSAPIAFIRQEERSRQFSEELRVNGSFERGNWMVGGYVFTEKLDSSNRVAQNAAILPFFRTYNPATACPAPTAPPFVPPQLPRRPCTAADLAPYYAQGFTPYGRLDTEAYAVFGTVSYDITDQWNVRVGLRYSDETKKIDEFNMTDFTRPLPFIDMYPFPSPPPLGPPNFANSYVEQHTEKSYTSTTPSVTVGYQPTDDAYLYATYSKGFKSGGFNLGSAQPGFAAEKITNHEIGAKVDWLERRLRTNLSVFYYDYEDIQANRIAGTQILIFNAPGATVKGAELEAVAVPTEQLRLEASVAWLDTEYKGPFSSIDSPRAWLGAIDLAGNQLMQAPKVSGNLAAEYGWSLSNGRISLRGETQYKDRVYFSVFNLPYVSQPAHWISNAFVNYASNSGSWTGTLFVRNIGDELVRVAENASPAFWGTPLYGAFAPPRTYGIEIGYHFE